MSDTTACQGVDVEKFSFSKALELLKEGKEVARDKYPQFFSVKLQVPDENSKMTEPYLYIKESFVDSNKVDRFPTELDCESLLAEDWFEVK